MCCSFSVSVGPSDDESSPGAQGPQPANARERCSKKESSPEGSNKSKSSSASSSDDSSSDDDEHQSALVKIRSSVAQLPVR